jgi:hypothetical protein
MVICVWSRRTHTHQLTHYCVYPNGFSIHLNPNTSRRDGHLFTINYKSRLPPVLRRVTDSAGHRLADMSSSSPSGDEAGAGACDICGDIATMRCGQCRRAWYCGPNCQHAAWGGHKSACGAAAAAAAAAAGPGVAAGEASTITGGGRDGATAVAALCESGAGGLPAAGTRREIESAVALLASRVPHERVVGARALARTAASDVCGKCNQKLVVFQEAVVVAGGIPLLVRVLDAAADGGDAATYAAFVVYMLTACNSKCCSAIAVAGGILPLITLLASPSVVTQENAGRALCNLSMSAENRATIASVGGIPPLIARLASPSVDLQLHAARALSNLSVNVENKVKIASAGGIAPLIALLGSSAVQRFAASALWGLSADDENETAIASAGGIPPLIALLASPSTDVQTTAASALSNLSWNVEYRRTIASAGGIAPLIALLESPSLGVQKAAAGALQNLGVAE